VFDFTSDPMVIEPGGQAQRIFVFPAGMYWRPPQLDAGDSLTVEVGNVSHSTSTTSTTSGSTTVTASGPANPAHGTAEDAAAGALTELAAADYPQVKGDLEDRWVPQISSKRVGLVADGITYDSVDILRNHLELRQRYNAVKLVWSNDWNTFDGSNWWVTVVGDAYGDSGSAIGWCSSNNIDWFNCFAKMISSSRGTAGTTVLQPH
jgi:hypothetical protein